MIKQLFEKTRDLLSDKMFRWIVSSRMWQFCGNNLGIFGRKCEVMKRISMMVAGRRRILGMYKEWYPFSQEVHGEVIGQHLDTANSL